MYVLLPPVRTLLNTAMHQAEYTDVPLNSPVKLELEAP